MKKKRTALKLGEPCGHPGCLSHVTHPCEGCGRIAGGLTAKGDEPMIELNLRNFRMWLESHSWPREVILHPDDFELLQSRFGPGDRKVLFDDRSKYFIYGPTRIRPTRPGMMVLDVSKERLFE
jgi:hypothetical protein